MLAGQLAGWVAGWLVGWLAAWLAGWLFERRFIIRFIAIIARKSIWRGGPLSTSFVITFSFVVAALVFRGRPFKNSFTN